MTTPKRGLWKKGRGNLGALDPWIGSWKAEAEMPAGTARMVYLGANLVRLAGAIDAEARWLGAGLGMAVACAGFGLRRRAAR